MSKSLKTKTAALYLGFAAAVSGCASTQLVKYDSVATLDSDSCLKTETTRYTTKKEIKRIGKAEDQEQPRIVSQDSESTFIAECANHETGLAMLDAYSRIRAAQIRAAADLLVKSFHSSSITDDQRMEHWRDIRANLTANDPQLRQAQEDAIKQEGLSREMFTSSCPVSVAVNEQGRKIFQVNLQECGL